jgi:hypothetical protein
MERSSSVLGYSEGDAGARVRPVHGLAPGVESTNSRLRESAQYSSSCFVFTTPIHGNSALLSIAFRLRRGG